MRKIFALLISFTLIISPVSLANDQEPGYFDRQYDFYSKQGIILFNSFFGSTFLANCPNAIAAYSMWAWSLGTATHIGVELFHRDDLEKRINQKMETLKALNNNKLQSEGDNLQYDSLKQLKSEHEEMKKFMATRRGWTLAIQIMYDIATALAILEFTEKIWEFGIKNNLTSCTAFSNAWVKTLAPLVFGLLNSGFKADAAAVNSIGGAAPTLSTLEIFGAKFKTAMAPMGEFITEAVKSPLSRAIFFGANAALSYFVWKGLDERVEIAEKNIADTDNVLKNFRITSNSSELDVGDAGASSAAAGSQRSGQVKKLAEVKKIPKCLAHSSGNFSYSEGNCKNPVKFNKPEVKLPGNFPTLSKGLALGVDMANAMAAGDMQKAEIASAELSSMAGRIKEIKNKLQDKVNADLKKAGKQPIDFEKEYNKQLAKMTAPVSSGASLSPSLASTPPTSNSTESKTTQEDNSFKIPEVVSPEAQATATLSESGMTEGPEATTAEKSLDESLNEFEVPVEDISKESTVSLFQQVSNRYFLNYTRFFERKKSLEEVPVKEIPKPQSSQP